jgi:voltage-gated potassium channel Kch
MIAFLVLFVTLSRLYRDMLKKPETRALLILSSLLLLMGVVFYTRVEGWSLVDALYFCVVTLGTVGYGDLTPDTDAGKLFTVVYIIVGLSIIGGLLATMGQLVSSRNMSSLRDIARDVRRMPTGITEDADKR